ncbi:hypothetical protein ACSX1C_04490 [Pseudomonas sp. MBLB4123]|uniref:hypothetical protein n=1 Tax=Pseudomonas sp. MBLB4123 TaxID=3451557 RepID=UPI003F7556DD
MLIRHLSHGEDFRLNRCPGSVDHYIHNTNLGVQVESLREKPHETSRKISQSPENDMITTQQEPSPTEQQLQTLSTINPIGSTTSSMPATPLTGSNEHASVQIDIDAPPSSTPSEEVTTSKEKHNDSPVIQGISPDESSLKASSITSSEPVSAMTPPQDGRGIAPTYQEPSARVRNATDASVQGASTQAPPPVDISNLVEANATPVEIAIAPPIAESMKCPHPQTVAPAVLDEEKAAEDLIPVKAKESGNEPISATMIASEQLLTVQQTSAANPERHWRLETIDTTTQSGEKEQPIDNRPQWKINRDNIVPVPPNNRKR